MKQGTTTTFKVKQFDLPDITEIIFSFTNDKNNVVVERTTPTTDDGQIHKSYPSEVSLEDGFYKIGLDQEETLKLNETFYVEAQIMFSGAVTKAYIDKVRMPHTFYTKVISGATTNGEEIELAMELSDVIEIGGGTDDYNNLSNKPKLNNKTIEGEHTADYYGVQDKLTAGQNITIEDNVISASGGGSYSAGNGITISNDEISVRLTPNGGLKFSGKYLMADDELLGHSKFLRTYLVDTNYTNPLASKSYVDNLVSANIKYSVVESLPTEDIDTHTIYLVPKTTSETNNVYDEFMYINSAWELIGSTEVDLSNYYTKTESDNKYQLIIDSSHKVSADNVDDTNSTNKFTNATEKSTWNGKQDALTAGTNITIGADGKTISATDTTYTAGTGLSLSSGAFSVDNPVPSGTSSDYGKYLKNNNGQLEWASVSGGTSYTFTNGLTESSGTVGIDIASGSELEIDGNNKLDIDLSNYATTTSVSGKEDKTTISTDTTSTTVSLTLADNHEYRYTQDLTSLTLTMPSGDFISSIVFASGSTPTSMTYDSNIKWSGDDITNGQFVPTEKTYNIVMWYDGLNINGVVRGV